MYKCQLTGSFNRCQYRSSIGGELYCTARYAGCGFRLEEKDPDTDGPGMKAASYVRKPRWYESYYPGSRPVK